MSRRNKRARPPPVEALTAPNLPCEIINHILLRLPAKSLLRFKCVNKSWKEVISDPEFIKSHHNLSLTSINRTKIFYQPHFGTTFSTIYSENHEIRVEDLHFPNHRKSYVLCSCEGLVLLAERSAKVFYLWNPSIRKYTKIVCPSHFGQFRFAYDNTVYGLCYDSSADDYKLVLITENCYYIYSVRNNSWGQGKVFSYSGISSTPSVFINGALHWVVTQKLGGALVNGIGYYCGFGHGPFNSFDRGTRREVEDFEYDSSNRHEIVSFNPKEENFKIVARPELVDEHCVFYLTNLWGCLGLYCYSYSRRRVKIWVRTGGDFDNPCSWEKMINISNVPVPIIGCFRTRPLCYTNENELVIQVNLGDFFLYNVEEEKFLKMDDAPETDSMGVVTYTDSMLLPGVSDKPKRRWLKSTRTSRSLPSDGSTRNF